MRAPIRAFLWRLAHLGRRSRSESSFEGELEFHLQMEIEENLRQGMSPEEARRRALVALGGLDQTKERHRDERSFRLFENLAQDLRFAFRTYRRSPGFVIVVVLTLMLGIGVNAALFTQFSAENLAPPPARDPARLASIYVLEKGKRGSQRLQYNEFLALRDNDPVFEGLAAHFGVMPVSPFGVVYGKLVSSNYFTVLGGNMILGRPFTEAENKTPGTDPVVVLSYKAWQHRFEGDPNIVGKTIRLAGVSFTIIGVAERRFGGIDPEVPVFWAPIMMNPVVGEGPVAGVRVVGRLPEGLGFQQARVALLTHLRHLFPEKPILGVELESHTTVRQLDMQSALRRYAPQGAAFGIVLLIACANVANLVLARAAARRREISVRLSLGASRARLVRQLLTESSVLALGAGLLALPFSQWVVRMIEYLWASVRWFAPRGYAVETQLDSSVVLYTAAVALFTSLVFGLAPALESTRRDLATALKDDSRGFAARIGGLGPRRRLVVIQLALCLVLLITASLLLSPVVKARKTDPGFNLDNLYGVRITGGGFSGQQEALAPLRAAFAERLRHLPGAKSVSLSRDFPLSPLSRTQASLEDRTRIRDVGYAYVTPDYFQTLEIPLLRGRQFSPSEVATEAPVAIISASLATSLWPGQNPLGKNIYVMARQKPEGVGKDYRAPEAGAVEVIGVAKDVGTALVWDHSDSNCLYLPTRPGHPTNWALMVRIEGDSKRVIEAIRSEFAALGQDAVLDVRALSEGVGGMTASMQFAPRLAGVLALLGLLLAAVGLYGMMSYAVVQRTHEIGVRMALGATRRSVRWLILREGFRIALHGLLIGVPVAVAAGRVLASAMSEMAAFEPFTFTLVPAFLVVVCLGAAYVPASRATRLDPLVALRHE